MVGHDGKDKAAEGEAPCPSPGSGGVRVQGAR